MINQNKLDKLEENLDNALEKETSESLTEWMNQKRLTQKINYESSKGRRIRWGLVYHTK